jgi:hypothetical protein
MALPRPSNSAAAVGGSAALVEEWSVLYLAGREESEGGLEG